MRYILSESEPVSAYSKVSFTDAWFKRWSLPPNAAPPVYDEDELSGIYGVLWLSHETIDNKLGHWLQADCSYLWSHYSSCYNIEISGLCWLKRWGAGIAIQGSSYSDNLMIFHLLKAK